VRNYVSKNSKF